MQGSSWGDIGHYIHHPLLTILSGACVGVQHCTQYPALRNMVVRQKCCPATALPCHIMLASLQCNAATILRLQLLRLRCLLRLSAHSQHIAGRGARKKWRESIRIQEGGSKKHLGTWIEERCNAADAGSDFAVMITSGMTAQHVYSLQQFSAPLSR